MTLSKPFLRSMAAVAPTVPCSSTMSHEPPVASMSQRAALRPSSTKSDATRVRYSESSVSAMLRSTMTTGMFARFASSSTGCQPVSTTGATMIASTPWAMKLRMARIWFSCFCCASENLRSMPRRAASALTDSEKLVRQPLSEPTCEKPTVMGRSRAVGAPLDSEPFWLHALMSAAAAIATIVAVLIDLLPPDRSNSEHAGLYPPAVDDEALCRAHAAVVGGEEQHHRGDVVRLEPALQALAAVDFLRGRLVDPVAQLPRGHDPARHDGVDADVVGAEIAREPAREAFDRGLARRVARHAALAFVPAHRAEVDDGPAAALAHVLEHGLRCEEHVPQVHVDAVVPGVDGEHAEVVARVAGRVVDEHFNRAERALDVRDDVAQRFDVAQVAGEEVRRRRCRIGRERRDECLTFVLEDVDERDDGVLPAERLNENRADPRGATRDEYDLAGEARVDVRQRHGIVPTRQCECAGTSAPRQPTRKSKSQPSSACKT